MRDSECHLCVFALRVPQTSGRHRRQVGCGDPDGCLPGHGGGAAGVAERSGARVHERHDGGGDGAVRE